VPSIEKDWLVSVDGNGESSGLKAVKVMSLHVSLDDGCPAEFEPQRLH
jgi:hypothetical protein